jgi:glycosyltransferase involved in cell wall biosynthesis
LEKLVTVAVVTYNSGLYVLETLESVFKQSYANLALVVSDDCSKDNTLEIVNKWLLEDKNQKRFSSVEVISVPKNTGVSANCNRCINASTSDWVKFIAGDDILLPNCIEDNMTFVEKNPKAHIIFSQVKVFQDNFSNNNFVRTTPQDFPNNLMHPSFTAQNQYQIELVLDRIHYTPSYFFNKKALLKVGCYDETNKLVEDYPMWLKLTKSGEKLHYFHQPTVGYRVHSKASNNVGGDVLFKPAVLYSFTIREKFAHPFLPWEIVKSEQFVNKISRFFQNNGLNKNTAINKFLYKLFCFYLNPYHYIFAFKKRLSKNKKSIFYK